MGYAPTWDSVSTHEVPAWYDDAKLGIFLHWGLYSVPGWAPQVADIQDLLRAEGPEGLFRDNPYAEWYLNSMQIENSPTWTHQRDTYGVDAAYDDFIRTFNAQSKHADLDALANVCVRSGGQYVVLTTKHHDGFTLWPASAPHPRKGAYHAKRDLVGDLSAAVRSKGLRMGLYYSGGYDWPYNDAILREAADATLAVPADAEYAAYAEAHIRELIDRYLPAVLWNDICWPASTDLAAVFAHYYDVVPEGVINDRWLQPTGQRGAVADTLTRGAGRVIQWMWSYLPEGAKSLTFPAAHHYDFATPEYATFHDIEQKKWEATRGVGHSFGANRNERPQDIVTTTELVRSFCDIVSKNGNLLIGIGPMPDGRIPDEQLLPITGIGDWLAVNGEAIYGTRPWTRAEAASTQGTPIRFTQRDGHVFALVVDTPPTSRMTIDGIDLGGATTVRLIGVDDPVAVEAPATLLLPSQLPVSPAHAFDLGSSVRAL